MTPLMEETGEYLLNQRLKRQLVYPFLEIDYQPHNDTCERQREGDDMIEAIIDWECARLTKPDKPLNAWETMKKYHADKEEILIPVFKELGLI